jgi:hypothetical protein
VAGGGLGPNFPGAPSWPGAAWGRPAVALARPGWAWVLGCGIEGMRRSTRVSKSWQPSDRTDRRFKKTGPKGYVGGPRNGLFVALLCGMCTTTCSKSFETFLGFLWIQTMMLCEVWEFQTICAYYCNYLMI